MRNYYKIGEISKIYNIGRDSLMYYEDMGLLNPIRDSNNYRLYTMKDIWKLNLIKELRTFDFSMEKIKEYINSRNIINTMEMLKEEIDLIDKNIEELINLKSNIFNRIDNINKATEDINLDEIKLIHLKERKALKLNGEIRRDEDVDYLIKKLHKKHEDKFYLLGNTKVGAIYDLEKLTEGLYNEYKSVFALLDPKESDYNLILKEGVYISISYKGAYSSNKNYINKLFTFIKANNYKILSDPIEIYKIDIHETSIIDEFITEIQILVEQNSPSAH
jgi:DNA-binding transcriptional MerR regulator